MRTAAQVFLRHGLAQGTMEQVAAAAGVTKMVLYRRFASKDLLIRAIFETTVARLREGDGGPWYGYGGGTRRVLAAARSFEDGYILLIRDGRQQAAYRSYYNDLRTRTGRRLTALLWFPKRPPPLDQRPALYAAVLEPMISFCNDAIDHWVQNGDPAMDDVFIRWCGSMMRDWRRNAAELLGLPSPTTEYPFETENAEPLS